MSWAPFDRYAERYDRWFDEEPGRSIFPSELAAVRLLADDARPRRLEVGVGTGRFAAPLGGTLGVDPAISVLKIARRRGVEVVQGIGEALPLRAASFDAALFIATLCFLEDARAALRESLRVLAPGGAVIVADIIADSAWGRFYLDKKAKAHAFYAGATFYTLAELRGLLREAGLTEMASTSTLRDPPTEGGMVSEQPARGIALGPALSPFAPGPVEGTLIIWTRKRKRELPFGDRRLDLDRSGLLKLEHGPKRALTQCEGPGETGQTVSE